MRMSIPALAILLLWASPGSPQDAGQVAWQRGDAKAAINQAASDGRAMMLFFGSEASPNSKKWLYGPFADAAVVDASDKIACIYVDCTAPKENEEVQKFYRVKGFPTVIFCDPQAKVVEQMGAPEPAAIARQILKIAQKNAARSKDPEPPKFFEDLDLLRRLAKKARRPYAIYFYDDSPASLSVNVAFTDPTLIDDLKAIFFGRVAYRKGSAICDKFDISRVPTIVVLDSALEKPETKPLATITGSRSSRELKRDLDDVLERLPLASAAPPQGETPAPKPAPEEPLSSDEVTRRFIEARLSVAQDMVQLGKKDKAIEILEDVIKSYPKHAGTQKAIKLLEDLKK